MKKFLVVLLACALIFGFATTALAADTQIVEFNDIADQTLPARNAIMKLAILGVIEGNEGIGGAFRPADNLTRAEFAKIVCYLTGNVKIAESLASVGSKFSDVTTGNWYTGWVNAAAQSGYFVGDPGGTFRPNANITMQEVVAVALRAAGYNDKLPGTWPANYATKASNVGLLDDVTYVGSAAATRADMALICNEVLGINMVVHISNEIAYALSLASGDVDPDGFSEVFYRTNENNVTREETILHKAFDGEYHYVLVNPTEIDGLVETPTVENFDESNGWAYEDYADGEIAINVNAARRFDDSGFDDEITAYGEGESLASTYYITGGNGLADLSGMQVQLMVIDEDEIAFVNVYSSYILDNSIYRNSNSNIVAGGKTYRASATMGVGGKVDGSVADLSANVSGIQYLDTSDSDNDFPGKIYLDKDGRIYAVKNYNAYNAVPFGIVEEVDNEVVLKAPSGNWKTTGSVGGSTNYTLDTDEPYVLYKDGSFIKADELEENDTITYFGDNGGHFYYVTSPAEGELTQQTGSKLTVSGFGYRVVPEFFLSDDGGDSFEGPYSLGTSIDTASFGEVEFATAYNFNRLNYITLNTSANKIIGVVTDSDPDGVWVNSNYIPQYKQLTIYNAEGKEVTYSFTTNFRNAYNKHINSLTGYTAHVTGTAVWGKDYFDSTKSLETIGRPISDGDIVQLTVDSNDNIKKISNYVAFDGTADNDKVSAAVTSSRNRITIKDNTVANENGTYTLPSEAVVFNVTADDGDYDDVDIKTVASTLSADFKAMKIVAFDVKNNGNINALYILEGMSTHKFGIVSGQGRDGTDDYYTINGSRVYGGSRDASTPSLVSYQLSGGDAVLGTYLAGVSGGSVYYLTNMHSVVSGLDSDYGALVGEVESYSTSTNALKMVGVSTLVYITGESYLYDFPADDTTSASSLRGKFVAVIYDDDYDVISAALLSEKDSAGNWTKLVERTQAASNAVGVNSIFDKTPNFVLDTVDGIYKAKYSATAADDKSIHVVNSTTAFLDANIKLATGATAVFYTASDYTTPLTLGAGNLIAGPAATTFYFIVTAADGTTQRVYELDIYVDDVHVPALASAKITGDAMVGETLTAKAYEADNTEITANVTYQWQHQNANGTYTDIVGATNTTYVVATADKGFKLRVVATAVAPVTGGPVYSALTATVDELAALQGTVTISGTPSVGETLTATVNVTSANPGTLTYQWLRNGSAISGATGLTYTVTPADSNSLIAMRVTAANWAGSVTSASVTVQILPALAGSVTISGTVAVGQTLTASAAIISANPGLVTYSWFISGTATTAQSNTSNTFVVPVAAAGQTIMVQISAVNYAGTVNSAATIAVPVPTYAITAPANGLANGVTATVTFVPASPQAANTMITATVTLTGTATAAGTFTIDLVSTKAGLTTNPVTEAVAATQDLTTTPVTKTFTFTMPAEAVDDLTLTFSFV